MNLGALIIFAFVSSVTPGPNNIMLWGSGMNFGFPRTLPHLAGINIGFASLILVTNLGLGTIFLRFPSISLALRIIGSAYLLYLAFKVATAGRVVEGQTASTPMTFAQAAAFQYVNPKAWIMAATAASAFLPESQPLLIGAIYITAVFSVVNIPCISTWALAGSGIGRLLTNDRRRQVVNAVLGLLLIGTVVLINV